jgi:tetratricopeptide (TPR) repeat protein
VQDATEIGDRLGVAMALGTLVSVLIESDKRAEALEAVNRFDANCREGGIPSHGAFAPVYWSQLALSTGDSTAALRLGVEALPSMSINPGTRAIALLSLIEAELARDMLPEAALHLAETVELCRSTGDDFLLATALTLSGRLARLQGDHSAAQAYADQALVPATALGANARTIDVLELLAGVAGDLGNAQDAARLLGAAHQVRDDSGYDRCVSERDADRAGLEATLGEDGFHAAFEEGAALSLDEAVAYARRGRGERKRPETGWGSLTPAEIRIAELVKIGLSNADLAAGCSARRAPCKLI